jgi:prevent-host-death family protein
MAQIEVMRIAVSEAKTQLTELVRLAEAGEEVILTRHGKAAVRLVPVTSVPDRLPEVDTVMGGRMPDPMDFRPIPVRGEPLSMTVIRDRR